MKISELNGLPRKALNRIVSVFVRKGLRQCGKHFRAYYDISIAGGQYISIGDFFSASKDVAIHAFKSSKNKKPEIVIGNNVVITAHSYISCSDRVTIGNGVLFGVNAFVTDNFHGKGEPHELLIPPNDRELYSKGPVVIEDNVWIGRNACIMPGVHVGKGAIIGSNSVVTHDVEAFSVVGGVPARVIKTISRSEVERQK